MLFKSRYEELKEAPLWWNAKANDLHASAGSLWLSMDEEYKHIFTEKLGFSSGFDLSISNIHVFYMLFGLSLELLIKSILVLRNSRTRIPEKHNLVDLAKQANLKLSTIEYNILDLLSEYSIWVGKYPIPKTEMEMDIYNNKFIKAAVKQVKTEKFTIESYNGSLEWENLNLIWRKIAMVFADEYKN